jgi:hypothetical protein
MQPTPQTHAEASHVSSLYIPSFLQEESSSRCKTRCCPLLAKPPPPLTAVDVFQSAQHLVQEKLVVLRGEVIVGLDDLAQRRARHSMLTAP